MRNAVDQRPRLATGSMGGAAAICSRSGVSRFRENFIQTSVLYPTLTRVFLSQYGTFTGILSYLSLESLGEQELSVGILGLNVGESAQILWNSGEPT